jgi:hypothetical protein
MADGATKTTLVDAFAAVPFSTYPRPVPDDLRHALLRAAADEAKTVRVDALYALGIVVRPPSRMRPRQPCSRR